MSRRRRIDIMHANKNILYALASAFLFGASTPVVKLFLGELQPQLLAGLLYLGSGCGLALILACKILLRTNIEPIHLKSSDTLWLSGATLSGGVIAPLLMLIGLSGTNAGTASLLLNLEGVFTAALAWFIFKENFDKRIFAGMVAIIAGGILVSLSPGDSFNSSFSIWLIPAACFFWGLDNNLTRKISGCEPLLIASTKGIAAGLINLGIAVLSGASLPSISGIAKVALVGFTAYGASLWLFILALRNLGTARTSAYFSTAPFIGATVSLILFREKLTPEFLAAAILMGLGVWLHLTERHEHEHKHEHITHEHSHIHDEHHRHTHDGSEPLGEPHSHMHIHETLIHSHPHYPDIHHRHNH